MGRYKEEKGVLNAHGEGKKTWVACLWSFLVSMVGGLLLGYWEYKHHRTNSQLWMVPLSLILLITPLIVWFSLAVSDLLVVANSSKEDVIVKSPHDSLQNYGDSFPNFKQVAV